MEDPGSTRPPNTPSPNFAYTAPGVLIGMRKSLSLCCLFLVLPSCASVRDKGQEYGTRVAVIHELNLDRGIGGTIAKVVLFPVHAAGWVMYRVNGGRGDYLHAYPNGYADHAN